VAFLTRVSKDDVYEGWFIPCWNETFTLISGLFIARKHCIRILRGAILIDGFAGLSDIQEVAHEVPKFAELLSIRLWKGDMSEQHSALEEGYFRAAFGFGRRICPGQYSALPRQHLAEPSLFILAARHALAASFRKKRGGDGKEVEVSDWDYTSGFNTRPKPFPFDFKVRDERRLQVLEEAWKEATVNDPLCV
jgi:hypothetical protein